MTLFSRLPIRHAVPLLILIILIISCAFVYVLNSGVRDRIIEVEAQIRLANDIHRQRLRLEEYLVEQDYGRLRREAEILTRAMPEDILLVAGDRLEVIAASNRAWEGLPLAKTSIAAEGKLRLRAAQANPLDEKGNGEFLSDNRMTAYAIAAIPLRHLATPTPFGTFAVIYREHGLHAEKAAGQQAVRNNALLFFLAMSVPFSGLWWFFQAVFSRRAVRLIAALDRFGQGDRTAKAEVTGSDELTRIGEAINDMIADRLAAEEQARKSAQLLKRLTDGLPILIAYVDREQRYLIANREFENWFAVKTEQIIGRQLHDTKDQLACSVFAERIDEALAGRVVEYEGAVPIVSNGLRQYHVTLLPHFEDGVEVQGCFLLAQDISRQKAAQEEISRAKMLWERTFDAILDDIITVQDKDFRILQINSSATAFFGIPREELVGRHCYELFRDQDIPCAECPTPEALRDGRPHSVELYHARLKKNFLITVSPMTDETGNLTGIVHSAKDITQLKQLEQQLRQAQKMEAIGTLAGGIAHDFNNILTPILGYSEMMVDRLPADSEERPMVAEILSAGKRAKDLVRQILTFSRQTEQQRQPVQIHLLIKEALKLLRASIPSSIAIRENIADCGMVLADPTQLHQVLMNLCTNAYHAMQEKGGELRVSLAVVDLSPDDYLDNLALQPGPHVRLSVHDTGCGIAPDVLPRIFDPYFTTKKKGEGTGLGLAIVHGIVRANGGHVTVYSELGAGTEFHVYLPQAGAHGSEELVRDTEELPRGSGTILVVDDEKAVGGLLRQMLVSLGYEVILCFSSAQGLETFRTESQRIDLVLTDMTMPGMNGLELARCIKQSKPAMPVVICSGFSSLIDGDRAKRMGIDGYLTKPVLRSELARTIAAALRGGDGDKGVM